MSILFRVESKDIADLDAIQLTKLLKLLLHLEARSSGIAESAATVALNINVADGGEDGSIKWNGRPDNTDYLPSRYCQFQNKATKMAPADCANEIVNRDGSMKPMVKNALDNGATYILFTNQNLSSKQIINRVEKIRIKLNELGKSYADTVKIEIYDAAKIEGWVNKYISAIVTVLNWVGRPLEPGLKTWSNWSQHLEHQRFPFIADDDRKNALLNLKTLLNQPQKCARIVGLSGLGKSRLAFEVFRDVDEMDDLGKRVVYVDASTNTSIAGLIADWVQCGLEGIVVVDDCDIHVHEKIRREIQRTDSKLSVLTLDFNLERSSHNVIIQLKQLPDEFIKQMLETTYGERISDLNRIVTFAQGFPQMAVLLADARLDQEPEMGKLTDDYLANKMLWGGREHDEKDEKILKGCALFDRFGLDEDASLEYEFIAKKVVNISTDEFYKCVKKFEERGLIDRRGRFAKLVPKPLAIRLAAEWWQRTRHQAQIELINSEMPGELVESFCEQVSMLDFLPEVKTLAEKLCGPQYPFGQAEVILSSRGSRLFRSFVEVNPIATSQALAKILRSLNDDNLVAINGDIRRNLVCALEKLCFHEECFEDAANSLLLLASAENENWSNNASGQFKQLFSPFLSGTEAPPELRIKVIDSALNSLKDSCRKLAVETMEHVIDTHGSFRTVGAEYQGSGKPLKEWKPKVWGDVFRYWEQVLLRLMELIVRADPLASEAKSAIARHIRGLIQNGQVDILDNIIRTIVKSTGPFWPDALDSIKSSLRYEGNEMPPQVKAKVEDWVYLLTPSSLDERLKLYVTKPPFEHEKGEDGHYVDLAAQNAQALAEELSSNFDSIVPYLDNLLSGEQRQAYCFGRNIVMIACNWEPLLSKTIEAMVKIEKPNIRLLLGILNGVYFCDQIKWENIVNELFNTEVLQPYYADFICSGKINPIQLNNLIYLISQKKISLLSADALTYGRPLEHLSASVICQFVLDLTNMSEDGAWVALEILYMFCFENAEKWKACKPVLKTVVTKLSLDKEKKHSQSDTHYWHEVVEKLLATEGKDFAISISKKIIESCSEEIGYEDLIYHVRPVIRKLFQSYGREVWTIFAEAINNADAIRKYRLVKLFNGGTRIDEKEPSVFAEIPDDLLIEWCMQKPQIAPEFVARATDVLLDVGGSCKISLRAKFLLDTFGDNERVLSSLSANIGTFGWTGSLVPYYQMQLMALETIKDHKNKKVKEWVNRIISYLNKMIKKEKESDEEDDWEI